MIASHTQDTAELLDFVSRMGSKLASVTHLHISQPTNSSQDTSTANVLTAELLPFASSFPRLVKLTVSGMLESSFLQQFGSSCMQLSSLHVSVSDLAIDTLQQLPNLLPQLTCLGVLPIFAHREVAWGPAAVIEQEARNVTRRTHSCIALQACPKLTRFETATNDLTEEMWSVLPVKSPQLLPDWP